jgi:hypothetical protein
LISEGIDVGEDLESQIAETLQEIRARKRDELSQVHLRIYCLSGIDSACLRFDKMMLRYVYYPILGVSEKGVEE